MSPNRIAVYLTAAASLLTAIVPIVADLDLSSTVAILGSLAALVVVVQRFLIGWQQYEAAGYQGQLRHDEYQRMVEPPAPPAGPKARAGGLKLPR